MTTTIHVGDNRVTLARVPDRSAQCAVTSPPYWGLRDYGHAGQIGLEATPDAYLAEMVAVFREVRRCLRDDGVLWLNMGDGYNAYNGNRGPAAGENKNHHEIMPSLPAGHGLTDKSLKAKDLIGMPWMLAFALRADGWWLRSDCIWAKPNPMPESVTDRPTKAHEYVFLLSKSGRYYYDAEAVKEPGVSPEMTEAEYADALKKTSEAWYARANVGVRENGAKQDNNLTAGKCPPGGRNLRTVWQIPTQAYSGAHFATFPEKLADTCLRAGTSAKGRCPACGAPWERIVESERVATRPGADTKLNGRPVVNGVHHPLDVGNRDPQRHVSETRTVGWQPMCECGKRSCATDHIIPPQPVPCVVLDPFGGAGTVGLVAAKLGLDSILCELNPEYAAMAKARIEGEMGLLCPVEAA